MQKIRLLSHADAIRVLIQLAQFDDATAARIERAIASPNALINLADEEDEDGEEDGEEEDGDGGEEEGDAEGSDSDGGEVDQYC